MRHYATRKYLVLVAALAAFAGLAVAAGSAAGDVSEFGLRSVEASLANTQAGGHGDLTTTFSVKGNASESDPFGNPRPFAETRDVEVQLPAGFVANLGGFTPCPMEQFSTELVGTSAAQGPGTCGSASQVGVVRYALFAGVQNATASLYELQAPRGTGDVARLGFWAAITPVVIDVRLDPERNYAATAIAGGLPSTLTVLPVKVATTIWGDPTSPSHDGERPTAYEGAHCGGSCGEPRAAGESPTAFARNSTSCVPNEVSFAADSYQVPGVFDTARAPLPLTTGCGLVPFEPSLSLQPTSHTAGSSSGVDFNLALPQEALTAPGGVSTSDLKKAVLRLPEGVGVNASAVEGLGSCSESQMGLVTEAPPVFDSSEPSCPESSKVGSVTITTPILSEPLNGSLYVAKQGDNPFHSLLAGYLVAKAKGIVLKLAGKFERSPSGRITAVFDNNPQAPFSDMELHLKGGPHGVITLPSRCGSYQTEYELTPWSGNAPATGTSSFAIDQNCHPGFLPGFQAGMSNPVAGATSPFTLRLSREDGTQAFKAIDVTMPPGLTAYLKGVPYCPNSALASVSEAEGTGQAQIDSPACPAASQIGTVSVGAGGGSAPFYLNTGRAYLAGPYQGAPLSIAMVTPAVAGPFDLGSVAVRSAAFVDAETARITVKSDPIPTILHGIPLDLRDIRVNIGRPHFTLAPTNCEATAVGARVTGEGGAIASPSSRFQVGDCAALPFKPRLKLQLKGATKRIGHSALRAVLTKGDAASRIRTASASGATLKGSTKRGGHPALRAVLKTKPGEANIAKISVALPHSEFLAQSHIKTVCTRVQFAAGAGNGAECPRGSIYGFASAKTPLLDNPLKGPVYLRSSTNRLPDLVVALNGQIDIDLDGRIDSKNGGIRTTFSTVPDAPVSEFILSMAGGAKGLIENSTDICQGTHKAQVKATAQNGKLSETAPALQPECGKKAKKKGSKRDKGSKKI